ncbi:MAG: hypothetical protein RDV48_09940 [Candidatus Eremiobacteraeota bacterium]|nr:hypothetical protein [Candidatus Eremiobacteraeota bacterium]
MLNPLSRHIIQPQKDKPQPSSKGLEESPQALREKQKSPNNSHINAQGVDTKSIEDLETLPEVVEMIHHISEVASVALMSSSDIIIEAGLKGNLLKFSHGASFVSGMYFGAKGAADLHKAIKKGDKVGIVEASGLLALAGDSAIRSAAVASSLPAVQKVIGSQMASMLNSPAMGAAGTALGLAYSASELVQGGHLVHQGLKYHNKIKLILGGINLGIGAAAAVLSTVGGVGPALVLGALSIAELVAFGSEKVRCAIASRHEKNSQTPQQGPAGEPQ